MFNALKFRKLFSTAPKYSYLCDNSGSDWVIGQRVLKLLFSNGSNSIPINDTTINISPFSLLELIYLA